jgi:hypothetical protein
MDDWIEAGGGDQNPTWDPTQNPTIQGEYVKQQSGVGPNKSMLYTLETADGPIGVWGSTVLDTKFENIPLHSLVRVEYIGMAQGKRSQYKDFKVMYKQTTAPQADSNVQAAQQTAKPTMTTDQQAKAAMDVLGGEVV